MTKIKKIIILLVFVLIIAILALTIILLVKNNNPNTNDKQIISEEEGIEGYQREQNAKLEKVQNRMDYYMVKDCIKKYYSYYSVLFNVGLYYGTTDEAMIKNAEEENAKILYNLLDTGYVKEKEITVSNIKSKLQSIKKVSANVTEMYVMRKTENIEIYAVKGNLREGSTTVQNFQAIAKIDLKNKTFSIIPQEYAKEEYGDLTEGKEINIEVKDGIEKNENNIYQYTVVTDEKYVKDLFDEYKREVLYDKKQAYQHLNTEYRNKKFRSIEQFNDYIKKNEEKQKTMRVTKYQKQLADEYTEYVCIDQNGRYYIFRENGVMNYSVILDTYTIDLPEFTKKYNEAGEVQKVGLNVQRIFDAINDGDYRYAYSKLDNTFKANNFKTEAAFEQYVKANFFSNNEIKHDNCQKNGNLYMYDITITDKANTNAKKINKKIIMQLKEGTDFVMSFNVK